MNKINTYAIEYSLVILFSTLGASLLISSSDIVSMYLSIELQSFGVYILSTIFRDSDNATSAGFHFWKMKYWLKLPNSGDTLKLLLPNYNLKIISG
jgi:NADH:ubiquinone oxidoreductase subunit 2 (subunit N)